MIQHYLKYFLGIIYAVIFKMLRSQNLRFPISLRLWVYFLVRAFSYRIGDQPVIADVELKIFGLISSKSRLRIQCFWTRQHCSLSENDNLVVQSGKEIKYGSTWRAEYSWWIFQKQGHLSLCQKLN